MSCAATGTSEASSCQTGSQSTTRVAPTKAGLNLEMPFPVFRSKRLIAKLEAGEVSEAEMDARALKMLELRHRTRS
jgi:hypothetical protein